MMNDHQQEIAIPDKKTPSRNVRTQQIKFGSTKWLTYTALFTALALLMKVIGQIGTLGEAAKLTPIYAVWLVAAAVLGPIGGGTVCFISDILIALVFPRGVINPFITIVCTLYGVIAALMIRHLPIKSYAARFIIAGLTCAVFCTYFLDSLAIWGWCKYYLDLKSFMAGGKNGIFWIYMTTRLFQLTVATANIFIVVAMIPLLQKLRLLPPIDKKPKKENKLCPTSL